jgi:DNA-directed RNA polymerase specialized sigma24 family protein
MAAVTTQFFSDGPNSQGGEAQLLHSIFRGNPRAVQCFSILCIAHSPRFIAYLRKLACSEDVAEDLSQEVWIKVWTYANRFMGQTDAEARDWLYTIVWRCFLNWWRREGKNRARFCAIPPNGEGARQYSTDGAQEPPIVAMRREFRELFARWAEECVQSFEPGMKQQATRLWWLTRSPKKVNEQLRADGHEKLPAIGRLIRGFRARMNRNYRKGWPDGPPWEWVQQWAADE